MRNRIVTAVKQRFSIRKLSIGAASVLLGTSLYFMGAGAPVVHAATSGESVVPSKSTDINDPVDVAKDPTKNDTDVNNAIDKYAQGKQEEVGDNALIRASGKKPTTPANTADQRGDQVDSIAKKLDNDVKNANSDQEKTAISNYINARKREGFSYIPDGKQARDFADQGLSVDDEKDSEINQISVDHKGITLLKGQSENIDGIDVIHTSKMTNKERDDMKINSDNKVIIDLQHNQCQGKEITVTYDNLNNSYYLENIDDKTNKIKISKIERTFSDIQEADKTRFTSDGHTPKGADGAYDKCYGPQLIIYNDPSDGFFYNNITQISVKDIYYDDKGSPINFDKNDKNKAWIFVTSLNSNGVVGGNWRNIEKVRAQGQDPNNSSANGVKIAGSTITNQNGWWYSNKNNWFNKNPDWDNRDEANRFGFVGTVAFQYHPGMTLQYRADDSYWGSHWGCTQTQVVSSLYQPVIIYDHIKDGAFPVTPETPPTVIPKKPNGSQAVAPKNLTKTVDLTVKYVNSDGTTFNGVAPKNHNQQVTFTGTAYVDKITGELVNAKQADAKQADGTWVVDDSKTGKPQVIWTVKDGKEDKGSFTGVTSPSEAGYYVDRVDVKVGDQQLDKDTDEYSAYTDGKDVKAVENITHNHENIVITVTYAPYQKAGLTIIDEDDIRAAEPNGHKLGSYSDTDKSGKDIAFTGAKDAVDAYLKAGYIWDSANTKATDGTKADNYEGLKIGKLDKDASKDQNWTIYLKHSVVPVTPQTPPTVIPKKPDGSQAVAPKNLTKTVDLTVKYVNSDGTTFNGVAPKNHNQQVTFTGTAYVDKITGELVNAKQADAKQADGTWVVDDSKTGKPQEPQVIWKADGKNSFDEVISPVENDYHLTKISSHRKGNNVEAITGLTQDSGSITVTVTYTKNGKIIPIDKNDNPITGADQPVFPTDPTDPTKVDSGNIPDLSDKGYHPSDKAVKPDGTVDPDSEDPSKDIKVKYVKSGTISVKYHDNTENKDIDGYGKNASGDEDDPFKYDPATDLAKLAGKGYVLDGKVPEIPRQFTASAKEVIINLKHGTTTVTSNNPGKPGEPVDPKNPEGPKYPNGTELDQVKRTGTQTIHYVGAGDKTPADNKQTFVFTREITFDDVTGKIISVTPWNNVQSHTFGNVDTPVIPGYHADKAVAGGETVTPDDLNKVITVTYAPDGNPGNPSDHGDTPSPEPAPEPEPTPNPTPDDQPDSEASSDEHFENVKPKDKLDKTNPKKVDAYKKQRKIIKTKIAKQGHTEIAEPIEDKVTRENNVKVVSDPVENKAAEPKLPQTGEADNSIIGLLGMLLASFAAMFGFDSLHSHDKKHKN